MCKKCSENKAIKANKDEKISFGAVNSCITIVVTLKDGTRVAGHLVQDKGKKTVMKSMKSHIGSNKVESVQIVGQLTTWTPDLENQQEIVKRSTEKWSKEKKEELEIMRTWDVQKNYGTLFKQNSAMKKQIELKNYIHKEFKCLANKVSVDQHEHGQLAY